MKIITMGENIIQTDKSKINTEVSIAQPFIRWVGGKRKLAAKLLELLPKFDHDNKIDNQSGHIGNSCSNEVRKPDYYEPLLGGGALFFAVHNKFADKFNKYYLSDINLDLVTSFQAIKTQPYKVIQKYDELYKNHSKEFYLQLRQKATNNNPFYITARFLYLNRYSFKGIYRINMNGECTSSFSTRDYKNNNFSDKITQASKALKFAKLSAGDYSFINPEKGDFVYLDAPYFAAGERFYTRLPFDKNEQTRLRDFAKDLTRNGVNVMLSNSNCDFIRKIYKDFNITVINSHYSTRDKNRDTTELVIRNY